MIANEEAGARALIAAIEGRAEIHDCEFEGARMRWRRIGSGPDLLLIHGGQGSWLHWVRNIEVLAERFTLWLPDLPGLGESDEVPEPATLERLTAALKPGVDQLMGARPFGVAAFSFGASIAATLAVEYVGRVTRFAMIGGTGHALPRKTVDQRKWRDLPEGPVQDEAHRYNLSQQMLRDVSAIDTLALVIHREAMHRTRLRSRPISRSAATREALDRLDIPILMVWGEHDPTASGEETARTLAEGHPNRQWKVIPDASHWVLYERPGEINPLLLNWFG